MSAKEDRDPSPAALARGAVRTRQDALAVRLGQLIDLFLFESDSSTWPGDKTPADRGDRYWLKRNAEATGRLAMRAMQLLEPAVGAGTVASPDERLMKEQEREAEGRRLEAKGLAILDEHRRRRAKSF